MKEQLLKTWQTHQAKNELLLRHLSTDALDKNWGIRGGRTIRQQFIHLHQVRLQWLEICDKELYLRLSSIDKTAELNSDELIDMLKSSANALQELFSKSWDQQGKIKGFKPGLLPLLGYFISHESHHRGNILLTLKQSGEKIPDVVKWGLWEWSK